MNLKGAQGNQDFLTIPYHGTFIEQIASKEPWRPLAEFVKEEIVLDLRVSVIFCLVHGHVLS